MDIVGPTLGTTLITGGPKALDYTHQGHVPHMAISGMLELDRGLGRRRKATLNSALQPTTFPQRRISTCVAIDENRLDTAFHQQLHVL